MISGSTLSDASEQAASEYAARYEALRRHVVEHRAHGARDGLVVLLRQGVAAWMDAWSKLPAPVARPTRAHDEHQRPFPLPDDTHAEVIHVLAAMTLGHIQEVRV